MTYQNNFSLLDEYKANIDLWKHDDTLRQQRNGNFLNINAALLVSVGVLVNLRLDLINLAYAIVVVSLFGLLLSTIWYAILVRNAEYIRFRRYQIRMIEKQLGFSTFQNTYTALYGPDYRVDFGELGVFETKPGARYSSTLIERYIPELLAAFWACALAISVISILVQGINSYQSGILGLLRNLGWVLAILRLFF